MADYNKAYANLVQPTAEKATEVYSARIRLLERRREKLISAAIEACEIAMIICCSFVIGYLAGIGGLI